MPETSITSGGQLDMAVLINNLLGYFRFQANQIGQPLRLYIHLKEYHDQDVMPRCWCRIYPEVHNILKNKGHIRLQPAA